MGIVGEALEGLKRSPQWFTQSAATRDKHLWTFGAWDGLRYSDNSRALFEYTLANCPEIRAVWMTKSPKVYARLNSKGLPVELCYSESGKAVQRKAGYFFLTKGPDDGDPLQMRGCHLIWLWHGMPLKQIGRDSMAFLRRNTLWKRVKTAIRRQIVPWQFLSGETLSSAPFFTPFLQSAFGLPADMVWEVGYPRNDHFFKTDVTERIISDLHSRFDRKDAAGKAELVKLLLYMPTHRDKATREGHTFDPFQQAGFDLARLEEVLEEKNIVLLYKGHFFDSANQGLQSASRIITVTDDDYDDIYTFIKDVDILLTDYSSIYFDFLLCRKPIILFPFDMEDYVAYSRPFYFDYSLMEGKRVFSWQELAEALGNDDYYVPSEQTIRLMNTYLDNNACRRVVEKVRQQISGN